VIVPEMQSIVNQAMADIDGDGIANDNSRVPGAGHAGAGRAEAPSPTAANPGVHVFYAPIDTATGDWVYQRVEDGFGMNGCVGATSMAIGGRTLCAPAPATRSGGTKTRVSPSLGSAELGRF
jgi:hypothetical protein